MIKVWIQQKKIKFGIKFINKILNSNNKKNQQKISLKKKKLIKMSKILKKK